MSATFTDMTKDFFPPSQTGPEGRSVWQSRWALPLIVFGVWTGLAFLFTSQIYYSRVITEKPLSWRDAALSQFIYPYLWAFGTLLVFQLAAWFPLEGRRLARNLFLHFIFATLLAVVISGSFQITHHFLHESFFATGPARPYSVRATLFTIVFNASENYGIYALLLLITQALRYYRRFREGQLRASRLEAQLSQAQLQALKMQLQPHFLFNTLHSISALVHSDPEAADRMIARLGDFLRLTLENSGAQEVSLQKELEFLRCYLEIERVRFQDRLTTDMNVEAQALDARVPNLILQPIVENAIRHGIAPRSTRGHIESSAKRNNGSLRIEVKDNGPGLPEAPARRGGVREGVGLANTRARLEQLYGPAHSFELANAPEGGLVVTLEIPARQATASQS